VTLIDVQILFTGNFAMLLFVYSLRLHHLLMKVLCIVCVSSLACRHATTSVWHCWSCTGCRYTIEFSSSWVFWCTWHTMDSCRCTLAMPWRQSVAYHLVGAYALLTQQTDYLVPRTRSKFGERAFCVSGPLVWNSLPESLRTVDSVTTFHRRLKTHFFNIYLSWF